MRADERSTLFSTTLAKVNKIKGSLQEQVLHRRIERLHFHEDLRGISPYAKPKIHSAASKAATKRSHTSRRFINRQIIVAAKDVPCTDCGVRYPFYCMDFDHVDGTKVKAISQMTQASEAMLRAEIAKCEVVCSNCHRTRTFTRHHQP